MNVLQKVKSKFMLKIYIKSHIICKRVESETNKYINKNFLSSSRRHPKSSNINGYLSLLPLIIYLKKISHGGCSLGL